jgi:hypothetical protein
MLEYLGTVERQLAALVLELLLNLFHNFLKVCDPLVVGERFLAVISIHVPERQLRSKFPPKAQGNREHLLKKLIRASM